MPTPVLPTLIIGPAIILHNGKAFYSKDGLKVENKRETFNIETDFDGKIDERMKSQMTELTWTPDGQVSDLNKYFPYAVADVGSSIFGASPKTVVIHTKAGQTITFPRGAISKLPQLRLKPTDTLFGDMTITCLGVPSVQPAAANTWKTIASASFTDASFDETKIVTDIYRAAYGSTPYDVIGSLAGFEIDIAMDCETIDSDDFGHTEMVLKSLTASAKFAPNNLTEAQVDTLLNFQSTNFVYPGQSLSKSNTDLVIAGSGNNGLTLTATIKKAGPKGYTFMYSTGKHRHDAVEFSSKRTWTAGVANELFTLAIT
jgi:hypothetical protein